MLTCMPPDLYATYLRIRELLLLKILTLATTTTSTAQTIFIKNISLTVYKNQSLVHLSFISKHETTIAKRSQHRAWGWSLISQKMKGFNDSRHKHTHYNDL